eukprot:5817462-Pyramimonas_sp.AAC.1
MNIVPTAQKCAQPVAMGHGHARTRARGSAFCVLRGIYHPIYHVDVIASSAQIVQFDFGF